MVSSDFVGGKMESAIVDISKANGTTGRTLD